MDSNKRPRHVEVENENENENENKKVCLINDGLPALGCTTCYGLVTSGYTQSGCYIDVNEQPCGCNK